MDLSTKIAEAAQRRSGQAPQGPTPAQASAEHQKRQKFRRLIDPGILRPNTEAQAIESMKILYKLSENLIREPDNPKFQRFKTTNSQIQKQIMDPKGTVEFARELGFHPEVVEFQPFFVFNPKRISDLKIGNAMLKETLDLHEEKRSRAAAAKQAEKEAKAAAAEKVQLAFLDDRKSKLERDEREKQLRHARTEAAARKAQHREESTEIPDDEDSAEERIPGSGHVLGSLDPPPYAIDQSE